MAPNPGIWGESVRKALNPDEVQDAEDQEASAEQALLDTAELRQLERAEFYGDKPQAPQRSRLQRLLNRLFGRSS